MLLWFNFSVGGLTDVYHTLLHSCWTVCDSMLHLDNSITQANTELAEQLRQSLQATLISDYADSKEQ